MDRGNYFRVPPPPNGGAPFGQRGCPMAGKWGVMVPAGAPGSQDRPEAQ